MENCLKSLYSFDDPDDWYRCDTACLCHKYLTEEKKCPTSKVVHSYCLHWVTALWKSATSSTLRETTRSLPTLSATRQMPTPSARTTKKIWSSLLYTTATTTTAPTTTTPTTTTTTQFEGSYDEYHLPIVMYF